MQNGQILVLGVILADKPNHIAHIVETFSQSTDWSVQQKWHSIGTTTPAIGSHLHSSSTLREQKFHILNRILLGEDVDQYDFVFVCDDDILLPYGFVDNYLRIAVARGYSLSQPARSHESYIDHKFVSQLLGIESRQTMFVEIGPLFCLHRSAYTFLLPFDERAPMGWGLDFYWPRQLANADLTMGIIDHCAIDHSLRKPVSFYDYDSTDSQMKSFFDSVDHIDYLDAFTASQTYPEPPHQEACS